MKVLVLVALFAFVAIQVCHSAPVPEDDNKAENADNKADHANANAHANDKKDDQPHAVAASADAPAAPVENKADAPHADAASKADAPAPAAAAPAAAAAEKKDN